MFSSIFCHFEDWNFFYHYMLQKNLLNLKNNFIILLKKAFLKLTFFEFCNL